MYNGFRMSEDSMEIQWCLEPALKLNVAHLCKVCKLGRGRGNSFWASLWLISSQVPPLCWKWAQGMWLDIGQARTGMQKKTWLGRRCELGGDINGDDDNAGLTRKVSSATSLKAWRVEYLCANKPHEEEVWTKGTHVGWTVKCLFKRPWDTLLNGATLSSTFVSIAASFVDHRFRVILGVVWAGRS